LKTTSLFLLAIVVSASGFISPPVALLLGLIFGLALTHPYPADARAFSRFLLQASVVCLGFGMNLHDVLRAGRSGFVYTAIGIVFALSIGMLLARLLRVSAKPGFLISAGTAICGGSAIAAVAPIIKANDEEMAVSLGTVFILNSVALLTFPFIGARLHLSQSQFGLWAALAIHDTSSVVGACAKYGAQALAIGTTVKLARALWIVPLALATAVQQKSRAKVQWPWFILFFCLAAVANTYLPQMAPAYAALYHLGRIGLTVTLFLIGASISRSTLRQVGWRPMAQGVILWILVATASLLAILNGLIAL
jgi:uncharacterized integral membrane protein (TIGR00698 family)